MQTPAAFAIVSGAEILHAEDVACDFLLLRPREAAVGYVESNSQTREQEHRATVLAAPVARFELQTGVEGQAIFGCL